MVSPPLAAAQTVVSLTFDDASADQYVARSLLANRGMKATFFVNSGLVGTISHWMDWRQVRGLAADGHEVGGHTMDHVDLGRLSPTEQRRQICNERHALIQRGFRATSFAYPLAALDASTVALVRACGYNSGRKVGGLRSGSHCGDCPFAELIPPLDPYITRTPRGVLSTTSLAELQSYVTQAENNGGGWVQLVLHNICDGCTDNAITESRLRAFLDWLRPRAATHGTLVRTVDQVIGGPSGSAYRPVPAGAMVPDTVRPRILRLRMTRRRFAVARFRTPVVARLRPGTTIRYTLSEPGTIAFRIQRALPRRGSCRRQRRRCARYRTVGTLRRSTGRLPDRLRARVRFSGRVGRRPLRPGRYRVLATATDLAGNRSRRRAVRFVVGLR